MTDFAIGDRTATIERPTPGAGLLARATLRLQSDERLVELTATGSTPAFEAIVDRYREQLVRYSSSRLRCDAAEDVVQQTFERCLAAIHGEHPPRELRPWLYRVAHNVTMDQFRSGGNNSDLDVAELAGNDSVEAGIAQRERLMDTVTELSRLPDRQRRALLASAVEDRGNEEIALELGLTPNATAQLIHRARTSLRNAVGALVPLPLLKLLALKKSGGVAATATATSWGATQVGVLLVAGGLLTAGVIAADPAIGTASSKRAPQVSVAASAQAGAPSATQQLVTQTGVATVASPGSEGSQAAGTPNAPFAAAVAGLSSPNTNVVSLLSANGLYGNPGRAAVAQPTGREAVAAKRDEVREQRAEVRRMRAEVDAQREAMRAERQDVKQFRAEVGSGRQQLRALRRDPTTSRSELANARSTLNASIAKLRASQQKVAQRRAGVVKAQKAVVAGQKVVAGKQKGVQHAQKQAVGEKRLAHKQHVAADHSERVAARQQQIEHREQTITLKRENREQPGRKAKPAETVSPDQDAPAQKQAISQPKKEAEQPQRQAAQQQKQVAQQQKQAGVQEQKQAAQQQRQASRQQAQQQKQAAQQPKKQQAKTQAP